MNKTPLLSVCLITYNHVKYIKEAIESVLMQKVNFAWKLIIADDYSTDGTRKIILEYKEKYPDFINLILQEKNVGPAQNWLELITTPKTRYIAYFEGDDYWIDPLKLQKQIDFLEANPTYSLCFHNAKITNEKYPGKEKLFNESNKKKTSTIEDVINEWLVSSSSMVFRREFMDLPYWISDIYNGDYALQLLLANEGPFGYINEVMSVYRKQLGGLNAKVEPEIIFNHKIDLLNRIDEHFNSKYSEEIQKRISQIHKEREKYLFRKGYPFLKYFFPSKYYRFIRRLIKS